MHESHGAVLRHFQNLKEMVVVLLFWLAHMMMAVEAQPSNHSLRLMLGSCNKVTMENPFWGDIAERAVQMGRSNQLGKKGSAWIWMGDNVYADGKRKSVLESVREFYNSYMGRATTPFGIDSTVFVMASVKEIKDNYSKQLSNKGYRRLQQSTTILGTWDDHDYGMNDGDRRYPYRDASQELFLDFLDEPHESPRRKQKGVYAAHHFEVGERTITVILLDVRYHKEPYCSWPMRMQCREEDKDFLGPEQWKWLEATLRNSKSDVNLIVSGIQILPELRWQVLSGW